MDLRLHRRQPVTHSSEALNVFLAGVCRGRDLMVQLQVSGVLHFEATCQCDDLLRDRRSFLTLLQSVGLLHLHMTLLDGLWWRRGVVHVRNIGWR
jgi:hypothetical protein